MLQIHAQPLEPGGSPRSCIRTRTSDVMSDVWIVFSRNCSSAIRSGSAGSPSNERFSQLFGLLDATWVVLWTIRAAVLFPLGRTKPRWGINMKAKIAWVVPNLETWKLKVQYTSRSYINVSYCYPHNQTLRSRPGVFKLLTPGSTCFSERRSRRSQTHGKRFRNTGVVLDFTGVSKPFRNSRVSVKVQGFLSKFKITKIS